MILKLSYDAVGRFTGLVDPRTNAVERRVLDARGRVILRLDAAGLGDSYEYDRADNLKRTVDRKGQALTIACSAFYGSVAAMVIGFLRLTF